MTFNKAKIFIIDQGNSKKYSVTLPTNVTVNTLMPYLIRDLKLPTKVENGSTITYSLSMETKDGYVELKKNDVLNIAGVHDGSLLRVTPEMKAGCFLPNTKVSLPNGETKTICELKIGDHVLSYSVHAQSKSVCRITEIYKGNERHILIINNNLSVTPTNLLYVNGNWQPAKKLKIGDILIEENGELVEVVSIDEKDGPIEVYNLYLSEDISFFTEGILVGQVKKDNSSVSNKNFFANGFLVSDCCFKLSAISSPFLSETIGGFGRIERHSLQKWWSQTIGHYGKHSCYGIFLILPSDEEAINYVNEYSDELDLISASDCLLIALGGKNFQIPNFSFTDRPWNLAIESQVNEGHSIKVANMFDVDYNDFPCLLLFKDILTEDHLLVKLAGMVAYDIATKMRKIFSIIHKASRLKQDPITYIEEVSNQQNLSPNNKIVLVPRTGKGKSFGTSIEEWINYVMKMVSILFVTADPKDKTHLRLSEEAREIQEKLQLSKWRDHFIFYQRVSSRPEDISQALLDLQPRIVHFSGHGTSKGELCFENKIGETHPIQSDALGALFEQFANQVSCVVMNACYSEIQAKIIAQHIDYVIGMNNTIGDNSAIAFAIGFYQALGAGCSIEEAYKLGCVQIGLQGFSEYSKPVLVMKEQNRLHDAMR